MQTSMSNGVSALLSFQSAMEVQANNTGNIKSTGFKRDEVSFSDMFYLNKTGQGVGMDTPVKNHEQGQLQPTNSEYDFAIDGEGFFTVQDPRQTDKTYYTRAGQFRNSKENFLVDGNNMLVMGVKPTVTGDVITAAHTQNVAARIINTPDASIAINTYTSNYEKSAELAGTLGTSGNNYKNSGAMITDVEALIYEYKQALKAYSINPIEGDVATASQATVTFPLTGAGGDEYTVEAVINGIKIQQNFSDSMENTLNKFSDQINNLGGITSSVDTATGVLTIESMVPAKELTVVQAKLNDNNLLVTETVTESGSGQNLIDAIHSKIEDLFEQINAAMVTTNAAKPIDQQLTEEDLSDYQAIIATNRSEIPAVESGEVGNLEALNLDLDTLGMNSSLAEKLLAGGDVEKVAAYPSITSENGKIYMADGDARFLIGQLVPVTFTDKSILNPVGDNLYENSDTEVVPYHIDNSYEIRGKYFEASNVDLSKELVNLLTFQKAFEANSKSITTSDEMMQTALALKNK